MDANILIRALAMHAAITVAASLGHRSDVPPDFATKLADSFTALISEYANKPEEPEREA